MNQEGRFHQEMLRTCEEAKEFGYDPFFLRNMVLRRGDRETAKRLLRRGVEPSYGLLRLWDADRLDLSVEALVLREPPGVPCLPLRIWSRPGSVLTSGGMTSEIV